MYCEHHLATFRDRYSGDDPRLTFERDAPFEFHACAKDIAFMMVRFFCAELGITHDGVKRLKLRDKYSDFVSARPISSDELQVLPCGKDLLKVILAANLATAHIVDVRDGVGVEHGFADRSGDEQIFSVITWVEQMIRDRLYRPNGRDLDAIMASNDEFRRRSFSVKENV